MEEIENIKKEKKKKSSSLLPFFLVGSFDSHYSVETMLLSTVYISIDVGFKSGRNVRGAYIKTDLLANFLPEICWSFQSLIWFSWLAYPTPYLEFSCLESGLTSLPHINL